MKVLVACECSGRVRDAFIAKGHEAMSCDLQDTEVPGPHYKGSIFDVLYKDWDMMIAHPPCTFLTCAGNAWYLDKYKDRFPTRLQDREDAIAFFMRLVNANIPKICIENPQGVINTRYRKPDQIIQPYMFGHEAMKRTCLWLKGLPKLIPTNIVGKGEFITFKSGKRVAKWYADCLKLPKEERQRERSRTFMGIANAMAEQWG